MRRRPSRVAAMAILAAGGGSLFLTNNLGCESFAVESLATALDMCFIFDCQNGILGGTIQPCAERDSTVDSLDGPLFADCLDEEEP